jgi:hypothetical protein
MGVGGQCHTLATSSLRKQTWYPLYRRLGGPQGWSEQVQKIFPLPGFNLWTIQPATTLSWFMVYVVIWVNAILL